MHANWRLGLSFALVTMVMWALLPLALKGILGKLDPITITWFRFSIAALIALLWYGRKSAKSLQNLFSRQHRPLMILAITASLSNYLFYLFGLNFITPSAAQIVIQLAPLLLLIGSVFIFKEKLSYKQWLGVATFFIGMLLFFHHRISDISATSAQYGLGIALIVAAAITWAGYSLAQKQLLKFESTNDILLVIYISGTVCFLPFSTPSSALSLTDTELFLLAFVSLNTIIAYGSFGLAMTYWQASRVSAVITMTPLLTLVFVTTLDMWLPNYLETESLDILSWLGGIMVVAGSLVTALAKSNHDA